jgi:hypothetical protein
MFVLTKEFKLSSLFGIFCFVIYYFTLSPTVSPGDSGDLLAAVCSSGVPHPPGFPLFVLLAKMFSYFPLPGSTAFKVNFFSAVCGAFTAGLLFFSATSYTQNAWAGLVGAGMVAFSPIIWRNSVSTEVFALNNLFTAGLLLLVVQFFQTRQKKFVYLGALVFGLGMSNHPSLMFVGIPAALVVFYLAPKLFLSPSKVSTLVGLFLLGLIPYLYLIWASKNPAISSWGDTGNWDGFWAHILRKQYGTLSLYANLNNPQNSRYEQMMTILKEMFLHELTALGTILSVLGIWAYRKSLITCTLLLSVGVYFFVFFVFTQLPENNPVEHTIQFRFLQTPLILISIFIASGVSYLGSKTPRVILRSLPVICSLVVLLLLAFRFQVEDQSQNFAAYQFGKSILAGVPKNSILLLKGDTEVHTVNYLQTCEGYRKDIVAIPRDLLAEKWILDRIKVSHPQVVLPVPYSAKAFLDANYGKSELFVMDYYPNEDEEWLKDYVAWPHGFLTWVKKKGDPSFNFLDSIKTTIQVLDEGDFSRFAHAPEESWEKYFFVRSMASISRFAMALYSYSVQYPENQQYAIDVAARYYDRFMQEFSPPLPIALKHWGMIHVRRSEFDPSDQVKVVTAWSAYIKVAPSDDPDLPEIIQIVNSLIRGGSD